MFNIMGGTQATILKINSVSILKKQNIALQLYCRKFKGKAFCVLVKWKHETRIINHGNTNPQSSYKYRFILGCLVYKYSYYRLLKTFHYVNRDILLGK